MDVVDCSWLSAHTVKCSWGNVWCLDDARWLTDLSWQDVVGSQLSGSTQRRWPASTVKLLLSAVDQRCKRVVADSVVVSQEMPRSATPYTSFINFRPQSNSDWLCGGVKSIIYHTLVITDFHQFKISRSLASCWVVGLDDVMDSSGLWLAGRIYRCVWDVVLSRWNQWLLLYLYNDDVTIFIHYDYIQLLAYVTIAKQVI